MTVCVDCLGALDHNLFNKLCFWYVGDRKWVRKSIPPRRTDVGRVGCPWTAHMLCFETVKTVPVCMTWTINVHVF